MELSDWSQMRQFDEIPEKDSSNQRQTIDEAEKRNEDFIDLTVGDDKIVDAGSGELTGWNDLRKYDEEHDDDWFSFQERKLAEQYGGKFISVKYADHGRVVYMCELCSAECNAKKSLELHCNGMKHLKKKDIWEKGGKPDVKGLGGIKIDPPVPKSSKRDVRTRDSPPRQEKSFYRDRKRPAHPYMREPDSHGRYSPRMDDRSRSRFSSYSKDRFSPPPKRDSWMNFDEDNRRYDEPPRRRDSPLDHYSRSYIDDVGKDTYHIPSRRSPYPPSPPRFDSPFNQEKANLASSPAATLLQRMSECCVKTVDDADLALGVVAALTRSLKEYSERNGESKIAELLMEAELKIGTVKALKVGMKMLSRFSDKPSISLSNSFSSITPSFRGLPPNNTDHYFHGTPHAPPPHMGGGRPPHMDGGRHMPF